MRQSLSMVGMRSFDPIPIGGSKKKKGLTNVSPFFFLLLFNLNLTDDLTYYGALPAEHVARKTRYPSTLIVLLLILEEFSILIVYNKGNRGFMEYAYDYEKIDKFTHNMSPLGIIIGLAVGFLLICFLAYFYEKKKYGRKKNSKKKNKKHYKR